VTIRYIDERSRHRGDLFMEVGRRPYTSPRVPFQRPPVAHLVARSNRRVAHALAPHLEDAADAGARKSRGLEFVSRGRGFTDADPTDSMALDPTRKQMQAATRRAATLILRAEDELEEAGAVIANGYLRLDREKWTPVMERRAALGRGSRVSSRREPRPSGGE
jgi:hypothetical protein